MIINWWVLRWEHTVRLSLIAKNIGTGRCLDCESEILIILLSITGLRKRNRRTGTVFNFNENLKKWEQDQRGSDDIVSVVDHFTRSIKNLGSISSHSKRPRQVIHCGITRMSEGGLERNIKSFINGMASLEPIVIYKSF